MNYKKLNVLTGWLVFLIATIVYFLTVEDTASLWDCGEYITVAYKLEVGHPPGAPLFMMIGRLFSLLAVDVESVAVWINRMSALSSSGTILFMFWSITIFAKKIALKRGRELSNGQIIAILGSGAIGALTYTFTDSFWFSAVEGEVYAMSSLFTAVIFWALMKWDEEMDAIKHGELENNQLPMRWMIFILFMIGLAIGVHLLGLLVVPTIAYAIYFQYQDKINMKWFLLTGAISIVVLGVIQEGIIPGTVNLASKFEVAFVNSLGLPFFSGTIVFFVLLIAGLVFLLNWSKKKGKAILHLSSLGLIVFFIGYGTFAAIVIRSNANTPLDENDPENLVTLHAYLKREQYGSAPLLYGPHWNSIMDKTGEKWKDRSKSYARRYVVTRGEQDLKAFKDEKLAREYAKSLGARYEVVEKYFVTNENARIKAVPAYEQNTFFPRMYWSEDQQRIDKYKSWSGYDAAGSDYDAEKGDDGLRLPTFGENINYFVRYQMNWMYWRYFLWNFAGRQNDIQGHGDEIRGNWLSGVSFIDEMRLGAQGDDAPFFTSENPSYNRFFLIPLIFGLIGLFFHFYRAPKDAILILFTFLLTGLAIVVYLNQKPLEPRERDYAYAASFYAFAMWIGLSVYALYEVYLKWTKKHWILFGKIAGYSAVLFLIISMLSGDFSAITAWIFMSIVAALVIFIFSLLGKSKNQISGAVFATVLTIFIPIILGCQGWDDHDRSGKTTARDLAHNYLESCAPNAIIFTNGDNDTFPLWYLQEVEGKRTDVRVANLSLMGTDWYTDQMKMKAYKSEPLPIKFREDQIMMYAGNTDQVFFMSMIDMIGSQLSEKSLESIFTIKKNSNKQEFIAGYNNLRDVVIGSLNNMVIKNESGQMKVNQLKNSFVENPETVNYKSIATTVNLIFDIFKEVRSGGLEGDDQTFKSFQDVISSWDKGWDYMPLDKAMEFTRDDNNLVMNNNRLIRIFPTRGFILPVNIENAVKSGILSEKDKNNAVKEIKFTIDKKQYLMRDQVMTLDILSNNDWKRPIYFSSNFGSDVSIALYMSGHVKQVGIAYELTPLKSTDPFDKDKMHQNLLKTYKFEGMNKPGVLTDYYARRHTNQYRAAFTALADSYSREIDYKIQTKNQFNQNQLNLMRANGMGKVADSIQNSLKTVDSDIKELKGKIAEIIKHSEKVMPANLVIDYGEIEPTRDALTDRDGIQYQLFVDGNIHKHVGFLFKAGEFKEANKLGMTVAKQLESIINYFEKSKVDFLIRNSEDFTAAFYNYSLLTILASEDPNGPLAKHLDSKMNYYLKTMVPGFDAKIRDLVNSASDNNRQYYQKMQREVKGNIEAIYLEFGLIENQKNNGLSQDEIKNMINNQN